MEGGKQSGSSLASDLFGAKDSSSAPSSGIFDSIFAPSKVLGRESLRSSKTVKKDDSVNNPAWSAKTGISENNSMGGEGKSQSETSKEEANSYYQEEKSQPFHYSSSIYYGGQDDYSRPQNAQNPGSNTFNKDGGEDDSGSASRGNWWQGSLYY